MTTTTKSALQFGAGNIGRAFIGVLLSEAGYSVVFADVVQPLIELINERGQYSVRSVDGQEEKLITVQGVRAINSRIEAAVIAEISQAALITTAVGPRVLRFIAPVIAKGIQKRADMNVTEPLHVIACENLIDNSKILGQYVFEQLPAAYHDYAKTHVGFPRCVIDKVVTAPSESVQQQDPLLLIAERAGLLIVEREGFIGEPPAIAGMQLTDDLDAYVEQKIFTLNTAHAITAYLGYRKGHEFIHEAIQDPAVRPIVLAAIEESSAALVKRHNLDASKQKEYVNSVIVRFENSSLPDPIVRVARDPKRKLAHNDRIVKPALLALEMGLTPTHLATGIAAGLLYNEASDPQAVEIGLARQEKGLEQVLNEVCGLPSEHPLAKLVGEKVMALGG